MPASTGGNDFFLEFGSNAKQFADDLVNQSNNARRALAELVQDAQRANAAMSKSNAGRAAPLTSLQQQQDRSSKVLADSLNGVVANMERRFTSLADHFREQMALAGNNLRDTLKDTENRLAAVVKEARAVGGGAVPSGKGHQTGDPALDTRDKASRNLIQQATRSLDGALETLNVNILKTRDSAKAGRTELQLLNNQLDYMAAKFENLTVTLSQAQVHVQVPAGGLQVVGQQGQQQGAVNLNHPGRQSQAPTAAQQSAANAGFIPSATAGGAALAAQGRARAPRDGAQRLADQNAKELARAAEKEIKALRGTTTVEERTAATLARLELAYQGELKELQQRQRSVETKFRRGRISGKDYSEVIGNIETERQGTTRGFEAAKATITNNAEAISDITDMGRSIVERLSKEFLEKFGINSQIGKMAVPEDVALNYRAGGNKSGGLGSLGSQNIPRLLHEAIGGVSPEVMGRLPKASTDLNEYRTQFQDFAKNFLETSLRRAPELPRAAFSNDELLRSLLTKIDKATVGEYTRKGRTGEPITEMDSRRYFGATARLRERDIASEGMQRSRDVMNAGMEFLTGQDRARGGATLAGSKTIGRASVLSDEGLAIFQSRQGGVKGTTNQELGAFRASINRVASQFEKLVGTNQIGRLEQLIQEVVDRQAKLTGAPTPGRYKFGETVSAENDRERRRLGGEDVPEPQVVSAAMERALLRVNVTSNLQGGARQAVERTSGARKAAEERVAAAQGGPAEALGEAQTALTRAQIKEAQAEQRLAQTSLALDKSSKALAAIRVKEAQGETLDETEARRERSDRKTRRSRKKAAEQAESTAGVTGDETQAKLNGKGRTSTANEERELRELSRQYRKLPKKADDTEESAALRESINQRRREIRASQRLTVEQAAQGESAKQATAANQESTEATTSQAKATKAKRATSDAATATAATANAARGVRTPYDEARSTLSALRKEARKTPEDDELQAAIAAAEAEVERTQAELKTQRSAAKKNQTPVGTRPELPTPMAHRPVEGEFEPKSFVPNEEKLKAAAAAARTPGVPVPTAEQLREAAEYRSRFAEASQRVTAAGAEYKGLSERHLGTNDVEAGRAALEARERYRERLAERAAIPGADTDHAVRMHEQEQAKEQEARQRELARQQNEHAATEQSRLYEYGRRQANTGQDPIRLTAENPTVRLTPTGAQRESPPTQTATPPPPRPPRPPRGPAGPDFPPGYEPPQWMNQGFNFGARKTPQFENQLGTFATTTREALTTFREAIENLKRTGGNAPAENENLLRAAAKFRADPAYANLPNQRTRNQTFREAMGFAENGDNNALIRSIFKQGGRLDQDPRFGRQRTSGSGQASGSGEAASVGAILEEIEQFTRRVQAANPRASVAELQAVVGHLQTFIAATARYNAVLATGTATTTQAAVAQRGVNQATQSLNRAVNQATHGRGIGPVPTPAGAAGAAGGAGGAGGGAGGGGGLGGNIGGQLGGGFGGPGTTGGPPSGLGAAVFGAGGFGRGLLRHAGLALENSIAYKITFEGVEKLHELVNTAVEAQQSFVRLQASIDKLGIPIGTLKQDLVSISSDTAQPIQNVTEAAADLVGTLKNVADLKVGTTVAAQLANVSQGTLSAEEAAKGLRDVTAAYGLKGSASIKAVGDEIASLSEVTGVSIKDITEGTTQLAQEAKHFGLNQTQSAVLGAEITRNTGETGEAAAEQVSRILSTLNNGKLQKLLVQSQVATAAQFQGQDGGLAAVMGQLLEKFDKLTPAAQQAIFALAGSGRQARAFTGLMNDSAQVVDLFNGKFTETGSLSDLNKRYLNTLGGALRKLNEDFENLGARLGQLGAFDAFAVILKGVDLAFVGINKFLGAIKTLADSNPLVKFAVESALAIGTLVAAMVALRALYGATIGRFRGGAAGAGGAGGAAGAAGAGGAAGAARQGLFGRIFGGRNAAPTNVNTTSGGANLGGASTSRAGYGGIFRPAATRITPQGNVLGVGFRGGAPLPVPLGRNQTFLPGQTQVRPGTVPLGYNNTFTQAQQQANTRSARVSFNPFRPQFAQAVAGAPLQVLGRGLASTGNALTGRFGQQTTGLATRLTALGTRMQIAGVATQGLGTRVQTFAVTARVGQIAMAALGTALSAALLLLPFFIQSVQKTGEISKRASDAFNATFGYDKKDDKNPDGIGADTRTAGEKAADDARNDYGVGDALTDAASVLTGGWFKGTQRRSGGMTSDKFDQGSSNLFNDSINKLKDSHGDKKATQEALKSIDEEYKKQAQDLVASAGDKAAQAEAQKELEQAKALLDDTGTKRLQTLSGIAAIDTLNETQMQAIGTFVQSVSGLNRSTLSQTQGLSRVLAAQPLLDPDSKNTKLENTAIDPNASDAQRRGANIGLLKNSLKAGDAYRETPRVKEILKNNPNDQSFQAFLQSQAQQQQQLQQLEAQQFTVPAQTLTTAEALSEKAGGRAEAITDLQRANQIWQSYADTLARDDPNYITALQSIQDNKIKIATLQATPEINRLTLEQAKTTDPVLKAGLGTQLAQANLGVANTAAAKIQADAAKKRADDVSPTLKADEAAVAKAQKELKDAGPQEAIVQNAPLAAGGGPLAQYRSFGEGVNLFVDPTARARRHLSVAQKRVADDKARIRGSAAGNKEPTSDQIAAQAAVSVANISEADAKEQQKQATSAAQSATIRNTTLNIQSRRLELQRQYLTYSQGILRDDTKAAQILAQITSLDQEGQDNANAIQQSTYQLASAQASARGDSVGAAQKASEGAVKNYQYALAAFGADDSRTIAAYITVVQSARAEFDSGIAKLQAKSDTSATQSDVTGHTVAAAEKRANTAQQIYQTYLAIFGADSDDTIKAQAVALQTARTLFDTNMQHIANESDLRATELETLGAAQGGDPVKAAQVRADNAMKTYKIYLALFGPDSDDTIKAKITALQAARTAFDQALNTQLEVLDFQRDTFQITSTQEIASLQQILKNKNLTAEEQRNIIGKIKSLQETIRQQLTMGGMNIPSDIKLPTAYQIRRSLSTGNQIGSTQAVVQNNSTANSTVNITNQGISQSDMAKITQAVVAAVSTNTNAAVRANTATPSLVNRGG